MQKKQNIERLNDFWLRVVAIPAVGIVSTFLFYAKDSVKYQYSLFKGVILSTLVSIILFETGRQILLHFRNKFPEINQTKSRVLYSLLGFLVNTLVINGVLLVIYNYTYIWNHTLYFEDYLFNEIVSIFFIGVLFGIYEMIYFFRKWAQTYSERERLQEEKLQSQLEALQNQINPHFLFNSLNTLEVLTEEKDENATQFVRELANVYRYILQSQGKHLNTVKEELEFINAYSFLLKTRFGNNLSLIINVSEQNCEKQLPPLTLQLLVENAMKHNVVSTSKPLTIQITTEGDHFLLVKNNLQKKTQYVPSNKVGLNNIKRRYEILGEDTIDIRVQDNEFIVAIPMLNPLIQAVSE